MQRFTCDGIAYFMPGDRDPALAALIALIDGATAELRCISYAFSHPDLLAALARAYARGVDLRIILDLTQSKGHSEVAPLHGLMLATSPSIFRIGTSVFHKIIHDKAVAADGAVLCEGSTNWTASGLKEENTLVFLDSPDLAVAFEHEFDALWTWLVTNEPHYQPQAA